MKVPAIAILEFFVQLLLLEANLFQSRRNRGDYPFSSSECSCQSALPMAGLWRTMAVLKDGVGFVGAQSDLNEDPSLRSG